MKVAVIGLGRFGYSVATTLTDKGIEVIAVDNSQDIVDSIKDSVTQAVCIHVADEDSLRSVGIDEMDLAIVAMGEDFAQSILVTALLKKRLMIPRVITRCYNDIHREIVTLIGANETIIPEQDVGIRLAERITSPFGQFFRITKEFSIGQSPVPSSMVGSQLQDLHLYDTYRVRCIARKVGENFEPIDPNYMLQKDDTLLFAGNEKDLRKIARMSE